MPYRIDEIIIGDPYIEVFIGYNCYTLYYL